MLDIKFIRENPEIVKKAAKDKNLDIDRFNENFNKFQELDKELRELSISVQLLREESNKLNAQFKQKPSPEQIQAGKELREKLKHNEDELRNVESEWKKYFYEIPNIPKEDVKVGKDDTENEVIRKYKEPTKFSFTPKDHLELGEKLDIIDIERAAKVSGSRFAYLKNDGVLLEFALVQFALEVLGKEGFTPVVPPALIKKEITDGLGYWNGGGNEDYYWLHEPEGNQGFYLIGTAEHSLVPMHMDETLDAKSLPKRYMGFSPAFRREAGSYGKDTKGILRVHQFDKVEMVSFVKQGEDDAEHEYLLSLEEKLFQALGIPYQVIKMCTGDLGFPAARKYDIEAWIPSQEKYREVTSVSTVTDFQARRLNIKYRDPGVPGIIGGGIIPVPPSNKYVQILNGTAFAIGRAIIAILENYQQEDGSIIVPEVLRKYMGKDKITPRK